MDRLQHIYDVIAKDGFSDEALQVRLSLGRPSSHATRQQALQQVAMLMAAKASMKMIP